jgi:hypothetical protein
MALTLRAESKCSPKRRYPQVAIPARLTRYSLVMTNMMGLEIQVEVEVG